MTHDPGGRVSRPLSPDVYGDALFDGPDACYRLELRRSYSYEHRNGPYLLWIGMNPSTADGDVNDPTVAKEWLITDRFCIGRYLKMNVSPYRATDPDRLKWATVPLTPAGHRVRVLTRAMRAARTVVACGVPPAAIAGEAAGLVADLLWCGVELWCLGTTKEGWPRHPLYMPNDSPLARWYGPEEALGPVCRFFGPDDDTPPVLGDFFEIGDAYAARAPKARRLRDLVIYQCVDYFQGNADAPMFVPAAHLANRFKEEIDTWAKRSTHREDER